MTDKIAQNACCNYPSGKDVCYSVYHSCANVIINGTQTVESYIHQNALPKGPYTQESAIWINSTNTWILNPNSYTPYNQTLKCPGYSNNTSSSATSAPSSTIFMAICLILVYIKICFNKFWNQFHLYIDVSPKSSSFTIGYWNFFFIWK